MKPATRTRLLLLALGLNWLAMVVLALAWVVPWPPVVAATCSTDTDCGCTTDCLD